MLTFRDARPDDAATITAFQVAMARETEELELDPSRCGRGVAAIFDDPSLGRYFVAEEEGRIVGSLMITYEWSDWRAARVWWIQSVYVREEARGRGVYGGLYRHVKQLVEQDPGVAGIRLYVDRRNTRAQKVYEALGMNGSHYLTYEWMKEF